VNEVFDVKEALFLVAFLVVILMLSVLAGAKRKKK